MKHTSLFIDYIGSEVVPEDWWLYEATNLQRMYYIKGGTGNIIDKHGQKKPFQKNHLYIFPYNVKQNFETDQNDRLDHLYLDFISSPPIIAEDYVEYNLDECSPHIKQLIDVLDDMLSGDFVDPKAVSPHKRLENIADAPTGSLDEKFQTMYSLIQTILFLLSAEKEIPYSSDEVVADALKYISRNYNTEISIKELAKRSGYSIDHFIRRFNKVMGMTPYVYLRDYRLKRANKLISHGMTNAKAAEAVGYKNVSSFSRELSKFKRRHNLN